MTYTLEEAKNLFIQDQEDNAGNNNLCYYALRKDGVLERHVHAVCWAHVYYARSYRSYGNDLEAWDKSIRYGYWASEADFDKLIVSVYPDSGVFDDKDEESYHRALERWFEAYKSTLEPASFEDRVKNGFVVNVYDSPLTREQLGAFLVGFRNLGEQGRHRFLNRLMDAGLPFSRAAAWNQLFIEKDKGELRISSGYHTIVGRDIQYCPADSAIRFTKENTFFNLEVGDPTPKSGCIGWDFAGELDGFGIFKGEEDDSFYEVFSRFMTKERRNIFGEVVKSLDVDAVVNHILEIENA